MLAGKSFITSGFSTFINHSTVYQKIMNTLNNWNWKLYLIIVYSKLQVKPINDL